MIWSRTGKEKERYYLLAGMGGSASRRKQRIVLAWSVVAGLLVAGLLALVLLWVNRIQAR
jgi:hypothetical protein